MRISIFILLLTTLAYVTPKLMVQSPAGLTEKFDEGIVSKLANV
jgi:hypothetical protein